MNGEDELAAIIADQSPTYLDDWPRPTTRGDNETLTGYKHTPRRTCQRQLPNSRLINGRL